MIPSQLEANKGDNPDEKLVLTKAEKEHHGRILQRMTEMRDQYVQPLAFFDGMSYVEWDDRNQKAAMSYIPPALNKGDTRIVTGLTREKDNTLVSTALSFNFDGNVVAFDSNDQIIDEVGENIEDIVLKTREMEDYESKRPIYYRSIFERGTAYVMEMWNEVWGYEKDLPDGYVKGSLKVEWTERLKKLYERAETKLLDARKVLLGNFFEFFMQKQPDVAIVEVIAYGEAQSLFGSWDRWKFVPKELRKALGPGEEHSSVFKTGDWALSEIQKEKVEFAMYMNRFKNELAIYLNGIPMLPIMELGTGPKGESMTSGFPLTSISPSGDYPIVKGDFEPVEGFGISKSQPSKLRVDQEVADEVKKLMILGFKQGRFPASVNNSGMVLTRQNFMPSTITDNIPKGKVYQLVENGQGLTQAEFSFAQMIKEDIEAKSVTAQFEGQQGGQGDPTATQVLEDKKQQMLKLGVGMDGIVRFERDLWYLRIRNFLANGTKAVGLELDQTASNVNEIFRKMTVEKPNTGKGKKKRKQIEFRNASEIAAMKEADPTGDLLHEMELREAKKINSDVERVYMDPVALRNLKAVWYVIIKPNGKKDDVLAKILFVQQIQEAAALFGPESLQVEKLKQRFANVIGEKYDDWFKDAGQLAVQAAQQAQQAAMGGGAGSGVPGGGQKPSPGLKVNPAPQKPGMKEVIAK